MGAASQRAAFGVQHEPGTNEHHPRQGRSLFGFAFPLDAQFGEKTRSRRRGLGDELVAARAVVPNGGSIDEDRGRTRQAADRRHEASR